MTYVVRRPGESNESMIKRFRNKVAKDRIFSELKKRRYFITKGQEARIAKRKGIAKSRRRIRKLNRRMNR